LLFARRHGGHFVLRVEDTDRARSSEDAANGILCDLEWLGLSWDEGPNRPDTAKAGPYYQSQRLALYNQFVEQLMASGHAYEAWETREELGAMRRAAMDKKENFRYRKTEHSAADLARFREEGRTPVIRFKHTTQPVTVKDRILGDITLQPDEFDDIVIRKADGFPTYHFAVVIDDHHMHITQILRGAEHLKNTHKHLGLYAALGWEPPASGHMPLIFNPTGSKMSKRDKAKAARAGARNAHKARGAAKGDWAWLAEMTGSEADVIALFMKKKNDNLQTAEAIAAALNVPLPMIDVQDFRVGGYIPEALVNYMALLGWSPGDDREIMTLEEMSACFSLDRVGRTAARFDPEKLVWMNGEYMRSLPESRIMALFSQYLELSSSSIRSLTPERQLELLRLFRSRSRTFAALDQASAFLFEAPTTYAPKAAKKWLRKGNGLANLATARQVLEGITDWSPATILEALESHAKSAEMNTGKLAQPIRVAISGNAVTPPIGETVAFLDKAEVLQRIDACLAAHADA
jgi:glutamyl-tRNA synthetase